MTSVKELGQKTFVAELSELSPMLYWSSEQIRSLPLPSKEKRQVELALEEALINIIRYAYPEGEKKLTILCSVVDECAVIFELQDQGIAFNPLSKLHQPDPDASLHERNIGGLGIPFIFKIMDEVAYERKEGKNIFTLKKRFS